MTNSSLIAYMQAHIGQPLSAELAADICMLADLLQTLVPAEEIDRIQPVQYAEFTFATEKIGDIGEEIKPLHKAHWNETECHRHELPFNMDYRTFERYERAGRYILFTLRDGTELLGNCAMYLDKSTHTGTLIATEDTLFLLPEARRGRVASKFISYCENALKLLGVREINVSVKTVNKAGRFFRMLGYGHVETGLTKVLEG